MIAYGINGLDVGAVPTASTITTWRDQLFKSIRVWFEKWVAEKEKNRVKYLAYLSINLSPLPLTRNPPSPLAPSVIKHPTP